MYHLKCKEQKKFRKKGFTTQFRGHLRIGQKLMVNRVMNIESVTNSIEHVTFKRSQKKVGEKKVLEMQRKIQRSP